MNDIENLETALEQAVQAIVDVEPRPSQWAGWVARLLESLELQAMSLDSQHPKAYETGLALLQEAIAGRLKHKRW